MLPEFLPWHPCQASPVLAFSIAFEVLREQGRAHISFYLRNEKRPKDPVKGCSLERIKTRTFLSLFTSGNPAGRRQTSMMQWWTEPGRCLSCLWLNTQWKQMFQAHQWEWSHLESTWHCTAVSKLLQPPSAVYWGEGT